MDEQAIYRSFAEELQKSMTEKRYGKLTFEVNLQNGKPQYLRITDEKLIKQDT